MKIIIALSLLVVLTGCTTGISKIVKELAKDPNTAVLRVRNPVYGSFEYFRTGATNASFAPDGSVSVGKATPP